MKIIKYASLHAFTVAIYVVLIASILSLLEYYFSHTPDTFLAPTFMLLLFIFSAGLTGILVFGRPVMWYLDGKKREAIYLLGYTLGILFLILIIVFMIMILTAL